MNWQLSDSIDSRMMVSRTGSIQKEKCCGFSCFSVQQLSKALIIYLGGYHNTVRREFLRQLYKKFPDKIYLHSGDIDAGGFQILEHLKSKTGIPFRPYKMDAETLMNHRGHAVCLSKNDRTHLLNLVSIPEYKEVISCMLEHNIKLEQEQIDDSFDNSKPVN